MTDQRHATNPVGRPVEADGRRRRGRPVVLVVDDDVSLRVLVDAALRGAGFQVVEAVDGSEAIARFEEARPDVVLLDVMMPGMDGYEACQKLRALPGGGATPIVMMTGLDDIDSIERAYEVGATDFTTKPINGALLVHRLRYLLRASDDALVARESAHRLAQAQRLARLAPWEYCPESRRFTWSSGAPDVLGIPRTTDDALDALVRLVHPEDRSKLREQLASDDPAEIEYRLVLEDGRERTIHQDADLVADPTSGSPKLIGAAQDVTERRRAEQRAARLAYYDSLTGLPNRALLSTYLGQIVANAERYDYPMAVLAIDLDLFKRVNDMHGHAAGDAVLAEAGRRIADCLRTSDATFRLDDGSDDDLAGESMAARLGGDEFVAVLPRLRSPEDAAVAAQRILDKLSAAYALDNTELLVSASIGVAVYPENGRDIDTLLRRADAAMYHAKDRGRNNYQFFTPRMHADSKRRVDIEHGLRNALATIEARPPGQRATSPAHRSSEELYVYFQPKIAVQTQAIVGVEALARWTSPSLGPVNPAEFIVVAEDTGMIIPLGEWILREACEAVQELTVIDGKLPVAVNISARQFLDPSFAERVAEILAETGVEPSRVELEVTESVVMHDTAQSQAVLDDLKRLGVRVAIDDFGTGYSSLSYLTRFPFDTVKIDQSFIRLIGGARNNAIISAIVALSRNLGLDVVAEGVEDDSQLEFLASFGQLDIQGFYFAEPMAAANLSRWIDDFEGIGGGQPDPRRLQHGS